MKGVSLKVETQEKWFATLPFSAVASSAFKTMLHTGDSEPSQHDDNRTNNERIKEQQNL